MYRSRSLRLVLPALVCLLASSCFIDVNHSGSGPRITGSGVVVTELRAAPDFHAIDTGGSIRLEVEVGAPGELIVVGDDNVLPYVETSIHDGTLRVRTKCRCSSQTGVIVRVRTPSLDELDLSGSNVAVVEGLDGDRLNLDVSGSATVTVRGRVDVLDVDSSGSSELNLSELVARVATLDLSGSSTVSLHVTETLDVDASGSSDVSYHGRPAVSADLSGSTTVVRID